jgi:threonine dehydratase
LLNQIAGHKANVLHIHHNRSRRDFPVNITAVELELETRGEGHVVEIESALHDAGYTLMFC